MIEAKQGEVIPTFGVRDPRRTYRPRPGAYVVVVEGGKVACVRTPTGLYLPGGGIDPGETPEAAAARECGEETGRRVEVGGPVGRAVQLLVHIQDEAWAKDCYYFVGRLLAGSVPQVDADHELVFLTAEEAEASLKLEADRWAIGLARRMGGI